MSILDEIQEIRSWFMNNDSVTKEIKPKFMRLLILLQNGSELGLKIDGISCLSLHESFKNELGRMEKIDRPNEVLWTGEPDDTAEELYEKVRSLIFTSLFDRNY